MDLENIVVDITQRNYNTLQTIQYDVDSRYVNVKIVNNGKNVDLTNYMVSIACKKPDGKIVFNETEIVEPKQGLIKFLISEQISSALGEVVCELKIYGKNSSVLTTQYFTINVTQPIADKSIQSTNEFRQLTIAMNEYNKWIDKVEEKYNGLEQEYAEELSGVKSGLDLTNAQLSQISINVMNFMLNGESLDIAIDNIQNGYDGVKIFIPDGEYLIVDPIVIRKSNITLEFANDAKVKTSISPKNGIIINDDLQNIKILNCQCYGQSTKDSVSYAISVGYRSSNIEFNNCRLEFFNGGIILVGDNEFIKFDKCHIDNMVFPTDKPGLTGGYGILYQSSRHTTTTNCYFGENIERHHIYLGRNPVFLDYKSHSHIFTNNTFRGKNLENYRTGNELLFKIMGTQDVTVSNNTFDGGCGHIWLTSFFRPNEHCENITITGNVFKNIKRGNSQASGAISMSSDAVHEYKSKLINGTITSNAIHNCDLISAIKLDVIENCSISSNTITNITNDLGNGIEIVMGSLNSLIVNNTISGVIRGVRLICIVDGYDSVFLTGNTIINVNFGIFINPFNNAVIKNNFITSKKFACINLYSGNFKGIISDNQLIGGNESIAIGSSNTTNFYCYNNIMEGTTTNKINKPSTLYLYAPSFSRKNVSTKITYGSTPPTSPDVWAVGDICYKEVPSPGDYIGWVCNLGGESPSWKGFGMLDGAVQTDITSSESI